MSPPGRSAMPERAAPRASPSPLMRAGDPDSEARGKTATSETPAKSAIEGLHAELARLAELCALGRFDLALQHFGRSQALQYALRIADRQSIEALLKACAACEREAHDHREALGRAVEREQALSRHLLECSERLFDAHSGARSRAGAPAAAATPGEPPQRRLIDP